MKRPSISLLLVVVLVSCGPAVSQPPTAPVPSETATSPVRASSTPAASATPMAPLPETIEFVYDETLPAEEIEFVKVTVNEAYWFYVDMGCSPDLEQVRIESRDSGEAMTKNIAVGWDDFPTTDRFQARIKISHEMAHAMCQQAISDHEDPISQMMWLAEGMANYFSDLEQYRYMRGGWGPTIPDLEAAMSEWVAEDKCDFTFSAVEQDTGVLGKQYPDYPGIGEVAVMLLTKTSPDGLRSAINYFVLSGDLTKEDAFQQAFGRTLTDFYEQFRNECENDFPTLDDKAALGDLQLTVDEDVPTQFLEVANTTPEEAYAFYVDMGCSADGLRVYITNGPGGENAVGSVIVSIPETGNSPSTLAEAISAQMAQAMCQLAIAEKNFLGRADMFWMYVGVGNYYSALERAASTSPDIAAQDATLRRQVFTLLAEVQSACSRRDVLARFEPWDSHEHYDEFWGASELAARLLVTSNSDGIQAVMNYYTLLQDLPNQQAFQEAFGRSKDDFYQQFEQECTNGFPALTN